MKLEVVHWVDSFSTTGAWTQKKELHTKLGRCKTVGWVVKESSKALTLVSSIAPHQYAGDITIPKAAILKRKKVKIG